MHSDKQAESSSFPRKFSTKAEVTGGIWRVTVETGNRSSNRANFRLLPTLDVTQRYERSINPVGLGRRRNAIHHFRSCIAIGSALLLRSCWPAAEAFSTGPLLHDTTPPANVAPLLAIHPDIEPCPTADPDIGARGPAGSGWARRCGLSQDHSSDCQPTNNDLELLTDRRDQQQCRG